MLRLRSIAYCITSLIPFSVIAQSETQSIEFPQVQIPYSKKNADIDGELNDEIWQDAQKVDLTIVNSPFDNIESPVKTTAFLVENGEFLFVSFIAQDPNPEKIVGSLGDRDTKWVDDIVGIRLDTLNNRRISYGFFVNPYGVQNDETFNEITGEDNAFWDGIWHSYGKITDNGYQVEIAIPYSILNFPDSDKTKTWPFELVRVFPRDNRLRISNTPLDRNNGCWLCQYPEAVGFEQANIGDNLMLTPSLVATNNETRDIYQPEDTWDKDTDIEASVDLRWGITPETLLNATINPDFSTVEADAGQLNVNKTFSLFYDEKRAFFLENAQYFGTPTELVYTRNIADPDYGVKLTGSKNKHSYGAFVSNDTETNFILSGNLSAKIASLNTESHSSALRYLYDLNSDTTLGFVTTARAADDYHNYVAGIDGSYRINESNSLKAQWLTSDTKYPNELFEDFCSASNEVECKKNEQVLRSQKSESFSDQSYNIEYKHDSEYWLLSLKRDNFGEDFRADLGFINRIDTVSDTASLTRRVYNDNYNALWPKLAFNGTWQEQRNIDNELINRNSSVKFSADGPYLSTVELKYIQAEKVGLRLNGNSLAIDGNTTRFDENQLKFYSHIRPKNNVFLSLEGTVGDKIDYDNNRLGELFDITGNITLNPNSHLEIDLYHTYSELEAESENVYMANLTDLRVKYYFDVLSSIKLSVVYQDIDYNPNNNPNNFYSEKERSLATQLIYSYRLNPQTVFFLGYSDNSFEDDYIGSLEREQKTFFSKISYAWQ